MNLNTEQSSNTKAIICAFFLAKFDKNALLSLGFLNWTEAFNVISLSLNVSYSSINQYRNIFDYYFPNSRKGWDKNKIGARQKEMEIMSFYDKYTFDEMLKIVQEMVFMTNFDLPFDWTSKENKQNEIISDSILDPENQTKNEETLAKRLITGQAAEHYFLNNYENIEMFKGGKMEDTRLFGCGFDFKIQFESQFLAVEVKGLAKNTGSLLMTEKEYKVANLLEQNFVLFVVKNFYQKPDHCILQNPISSNLNFKKIEKTIIQTSYQCSI